MPRNLAKHNYDQYRTALRKIADGCEFDKITPDQILRDRLVFGIRDAKARERLLRESDLTLQKTDEICHAAESMLAQVKMVDDNLGSTVNAVKSDGDQQKKSNNGKNLKTADDDMSSIRGSYAPLMVRRTCTKCRKQNHFAVKCRSKTPSQTVPRRRRKCFRRASQVMAQTTLNLSH